MREWLPTSEGAPVDDPWPVGAKREVPSIRIVRVGVDRRRQDHRRRLVVAISWRWRRRIGVSWRLSIAVVWRRLLVAVALLVALLIAIAPLWLRRIVLIRRWWLRLAVARLRVGRGHIGGRRRPDAGAHAERRSSHPFHQVVHDPLLDCRTQDKQQQLSGKS